MTQMPRSERATCAHSQAGIKMVGTGLWWTDGGWSTLDRRLDVYGYMKTVVTPARRQAMQHDAPTRKN
jgi:hypothetical protein